MESIGSSESQLVDSKMRHVDRKCRRGDNLTPLQTPQLTMGWVLEQDADINKTVRAKGPRLPIGCLFLDPPMANLEPDAPVSQWARGFAAGHMWLEDAWDRYLPEEMEEEMGGALAALSVSRRSGSRCPEAGKPRN